jgi:hypothetical protein
MRRMTSPRRAIAAALPLAALLCGLPARSPRAADCGCGGAGCTAPPGPACVPECRSSWEERKTKKPQYSIKCEYSCARAAEPWHTGGAECRRRPPCGNVSVKKKLCKTEKEKVERAPKYEVTMAPVDPCAQCDECRVCWWNPFSILHHLLRH